MTTDQARVWTWDRPVAPLLELIARGGILAIPTESSYGLGVDPRNREAVERVFRVKGRAADQPLPVVVSDLDQIRRLGGQPESLERSGLTAAWPASLTLLLPIREPVPAAARSDRLGFRIPDHPRLRDLLSRLGTGLTATSANRSGEAPILRPNALADLLRSVDAMIVDDGELPGGEPSTVAGLRAGELEIVRQGRFPLDGWLSFSAPSVEISVDESR